MNEKPKAIFSHSLESADWGPAEVFGGDLGDQQERRRCRLSSYAPERI
jgi:hypothetical protein